MVLGRRNPLVAGSDVGDESARRYSTTAIRISTNPHAPLKPRGSPSARQDDCATAGTRLAVRVFGGLDLTAKHIERLDDVVQGCQQPWR